MTLADLCHGMPGIRDGRREALVIAAAGREGLASLAKLEATHGPLAGELFGEAFTVGRTYESEAQILYFAPPTEAASLQRGVTMAPGLTAQVTRVDLSEATAEGPGASTWVVMQVGGQTRAQGLPEAPTAWRLAIGNASGVKA